MATQVVEIYNDVCISLLENFGFPVLGIMTDQDFFNYLGDVVQDFMSRTGIIKKIFNIPALFNIPAYTEPDNAMDVQVVSYSQTYIYRASGWYLDNSNAYWNNAASFPERWREDEIPPKMLQIEPMPTVDGDQVVTLPSTPGYGVIAATSAAVDFDLIAESGAGYGTINSTDGPLPGGTGSVYVEALNAGYGTVASMVSSTGNIEMVSTAQPVSYPQTIYDYFQLLPDSFLPYIRYGILAKIWSEDGEYKDNNRAKYATARFTEGINLAAAIMSEVGMEGE